MLSHMLVRRAASTVCNGGQERRNPRGMLCNIMRSLSSCTTNRIVRIYYATAKQVDFARLLKYIYTYVAG